MQLRLAAAVIGISLAICVGYSLLRPANGGAVVPVVYAPNAIGTPRIELDHETFDFGVMNVGETGTHTFRIRNTGTAPLTVEVTNTSCKCTLVKLPKEGIPPGESREMTIEWQTKEPIDGFRHGGVLLTNDPERKSIKVFVEGKVRAKLVFIPDLVAFTDVIPGRARVAEAVVASHVWDKFDVEVAEVTLAGVTVQAEPWTDARRKDAHEWIRGASLLTIRCDATLPLGIHRGAIRLRVRGVDNDPVAAQIHELPLTVDMVSPFTIHGKHVVGNALEWGAIRQGAGRRESIMVIGRNVPEGFAITGIQCKPDVFHVTHRRQDPQTGTTARYTLELELPKSAAPVNCMTPHVAQVLLQTNHPQFPEVKFYIEFAVIE